MSIKELQARGLRYAIIDTISGKIASVAKTLEEVEEFPFKPKEFAYVDLKQGIAFDFVTTWNYIPEEWDFQE